MAGGAEEDVARATTLLDPCGTVRHLGPLGAGEVAKACNQMIVGATMMAISEATVLAERSGIAPTDLFEVLEGGYAGSTLLADKRDKLVAGDYSPGGIAAYMTKDLGFAADVAEDTGTSPALLGALRGAYDELVAAGLGEEDLSVARRLLTERGVRQLAQLRQALPHLQLAADGGRAGAGRAPTIAEEHRVPDPPASPPHRRRARPPPARRP